MAPTIPGYYSRESEFQGGLRGACGPNALAAAASRSLQRYVSTLDVYNRMRAAGMSVPNGISDIAQLQQAAHLLALPVTGYQPYTSSAWGWQSFLDAHLSQGPVVLEVANGQALKDALTGQGENARNLRYHFIAVLGKDSGGNYLVADGDNFAVGNVLQTYAAATLSAAAPCAALAIAQVAKIVVPAAPKPAWITVQGPDGSQWYQQTATGKRLGGGLRAALVAQKWDGLPLRNSEVRYPNAASPFSAVAVGSGKDCHILVWDHEHSQPLIGYDAEVAADLLTTLPGA